MRSVPGCYNGWNLSNIYFYMGFSPDNSLHFIQSQSLFISHLAVLTFCVLSLAWNFLSSNDRIPPPWYTHATFHLNAASSFWASVMDFSLSSLAQTILTLLFLYFKFPLLNYTLLKDRDNSAFFIFLLSPSLFIYLGRLHSLQES